LGVSHPISARKAREIAFKASEDTEKQGEALLHLIRAVKAQQALFFARGFFGRVKFLLRGK
jgi:hypothetical protein